MFFIGIFGVQSKAKTIKTDAGAVCPICEAYDRYDVVKVFDYFHIFFITVWKWNNRYFIQTRCCQRRCSLDSDIGARIAAGEELEIKKEHIDCAGATAVLCPNCGQALHPSYQYCPYCGTPT